MKTGYLIDARTNIEEIYNISDFIVSEELKILRVLAQDTIFSVGQTLSHQDYYSTFVFANENNLRFWIPATFYKDNEQAVIDLLMSGRSSLDIVLYGSFMLFEILQENTARLFELKRTGKVYLAPLVIFDKITAASFTYNLKFLKTRNPSMEKSIVAIVPQKEFANYLVANPNFCDELVLWSYSETKKHGILTAIERNTQMAKKMQATPIKKVTVKGIIVIGPLGVRKSPDISSKTYKILPKGAQLSFMKIISPIPGLTFGQLAEDQWVLISYGRKTYVQINT